MRRGDAAGASSAFMKCPNCDYLFAGGESCICCGIPLAPRSGAHVPQR